MRNSNRENKREKEEKEIKGGKERARKMCQIEKDNEIKSSRIRMRMKTEKIER